MHQSLNERKIQANRRNAQKSTGPTSPQGKAAVARNALKSGIYAQAIIVRGESQEVFDALSAEYHHELEPATLEARSLVNELVLCEWRLRRFAVIEAELFRSDPVGYAYDTRQKSFSALQRQIDSTRRARDRAFLRLREIQPPAAQLETATQPVAAACPSRPSPKTETPYIPATYTPSWVCSANPLLDPPPAPSAAPLNGTTMTSGTC